MSEAGTQQVANGESPATGARSFAQRFVGAFRLDGSVFEEVASDPGALGQAAGVAAIAAVVRAVGVLTATTSGEAVFGALSVFAFWPIASLLIWLAGNLLRCPSEFGRVLRVVGFAMAPLVLVALVLVPNEWFRGGVLLVTYALLFGALLVGVRSALRVDTGRAAFVCVVFALALFLLYSAVIYFTYQTGGGQ
jgi:hypothetical protein